MNKNPVAAKNNGDGVVLFDLRFKKRHFQPKGTTMSDSIKKALTCALLILLGGSAYVLIEIMFRGYSHISMFALGGICLALIDLTDRSLCNLSIFSKAAICGLIISAAELAAGIILNIYLKLGVWDYSGLRFNLLGQVCPQFTLIWVALSIPAIHLARAIRRYVLRLA